MTSRRLLSPVSRALLDAADYIEKHGWCQHSLQDPNGRVCIFGAIDLVTADPDVLGNAVVRLSRQVSYYPITAWNDAPERTKQEVVDTLRAAAMAEVGP